MPLRTAGAVRCTALAKLGSGVMRRPQWRPPGAVCCLQRAAQPCSWLPRSAAPARHSYSRRGLAHSCAACSTDSADGGEEEEEEEFTGVSQTLQVLEEMKSKDLDSLLQQIEKGRINLTPNYQRQYIWRRDKAYRLVESVLANLFVPAVVLHTNSKKEDDVVDGKQRLTSLLSFKRGRFPDGSECRLAGLNLLPQLNGLTYQDLPEIGDFPSRKDFDDFTLTVTKFAESTSQEAVLRVYEDLNCGAESLNKQQIRRAVYGGPYIDLLDRLVRNEKFQQLLGAREADTSEKGQELILRFFALWRHGHIAFGGTLDKFLSRELAQHRHLGPDGGGREAAELQCVFETTVDLVWDVYGESAFKRWTGSGYHKAFAPGLFDCIMLTLSRHTFNPKDRARVRAAGNALREDLNQLCLDKRFRALLLARFSRQRLCDRVDEFRPRFRTAVEQARAQRTEQQQQQQQPASVRRAFKNPEQLKQQLYVAQNQQCAVCGSTMQRLEDTELDHKVPYSKGGSSSDDNAQLVHRGCNRAKGAKSDHEFWTVLAAPLGSLRTEL